MSDISKCDGAGCPQKEKCWRYLAPTSPHWQSYIKSQWNGENCPLIMPRMAGEK